MIKESEAQKPVIILGLGTCGLAAGGQAIWDFLIDLNKNGVIDVILKQTGCIGYCQMEVMLDIKLPGKPKLTFHEVTVAKMERIVNEYILGGSVPQDLVLAISEYFPDAKPETLPRGYDKLMLLQDLPFFNKQKRLVLSNCGIIDPDSIEEYISRNGYQALAKAVSMESADVVKEVLDSGLRGRGGGGFPTGKKWKFAMDQKSEQKYIVANADEGDPGAFMDRAVLEGDPHRVIEGMIIGGYAIGASKGYIYCRAEYPLAIKRLQTAIARCYELQILGEDILGTGFKFDLIIKMGAGAFVCGEETALIASIEGKRGMPKPRPPFPAVAGIFNKPTVINNVETFANVPEIFRSGAKQYASIGTDNSKGTKVFALTGMIARSGLIEVPMGITLREIIFDIGGGIPDNQNYKAAQIGGPSGGCLPTSCLDTAIDYDSLIAAGAMMGSGGLVVMDEKTCMVDVARFFINFIKSESCGKCIPCREGITRLQEMLDNIVKPPVSDTESALERFKSVIELEKTCNIIKDTAACGLGQTAPNPILSTLRYFRDEYEKHIFGQSCPAGKCRSLLKFRISAEACKGCGLCKRKCPNAAIIGEIKHAHYIVEDKCIKCGVCNEVCPFDAVSFN
ncbi:MAG: NADH-quinone oxidoreductase subunit F [Candidatus Wallbacteria bacterium HGW-Wallbacteria-1]|uniref:NADH-quinone oxidoreductase subunit F n=1 Tax=Candidatus Wallbacteria bacterium HGW-Wallbacteria-1 TaxID=2013854 RepID=A0A2N1PT79_9BACT|nr:MAG: NADH-quinone oxidoreductase subunit F [Candidatus Wallbacteria bacterium HGW-Wallbacteria-1]